VVFVREEGTALAVLPVAVKLVALVACRRRRLSYCNKCPRYAGGACRVIFVHVVAFILWSDAQHLTTGTRLCTIMPAHLHACTIACDRPLGGFGLFSARIGQWTAACVRTTSPQTALPHRDVEMLHQAGPLDLPRSISRRLQPASPCPFQLQAIPS